MQHSLIMRNFLLIFSVGFDIKPQQCIFLTFQFLFDANKPLMIFILKKFLNGTKLVQISFKRKILQTTIILPLEEWTFLFIYITSGKGLYECISVWRGQGGNSLTHFFLFITVNANVSNTPHERKTLNDYLAY